MKNEKLKIEYLAAGEKPRPVTRAVTAKSRKRQTPEEAVKSVMRNYQRMKIKAMLAKTEDDRRRYLGQADFYKKRADLIRSVSLNGNRAEILSGAYVHTN